MGSVVRLKDIAEKTGFSTNTVSLALRDSPRIPERTRDRIRKAARELNYLPNQIAKSLVSRRTETVGLVLTQVTNPMLTRTAQLLEGDLAARGYGTLFATSNNRLDHERRVIEMFRARQVDGMLVYPASPEDLDHIRRLRRAGHPIVLLVNDPTGTLDSVSMNDRQGAEIATAHLIAHGHTRIGFIGATRPGANLDKLIGYREALANHGLAYAASLCAAPAGPGAADGHDAAARLMAVPEPPTAVFAATDTLAFGVMKWARDVGRAIPADLAVIGYDDIELARFSEVPLSSVRYHAGAVASGAIDRLMTLMSAGDPLPAASNALIAPELVVRASSVPAG